MRLVKAPRATWETCGHRLTVAIGLGMTALALVLGIAAVWATSDRLGLTAVLLGAPGVLVAIAGAINEDGSHCHHPTLAVPLPWRTRAEDD